MSGMDITLVKKLVYICAKVWYNRYMKLIMETL